MPTCGRVALLKCVLTEQLVNIHGADENLTGFTALCGTHDTCMFHLIHQSAGTVVTNLVTTLQRRSAGSVAHDYKLHGLFKQRVTVLDIAHVGITITTLVSAHIFGQHVGLLVVDVAVLVLLVLDEIADAHDVGSVDKRTLQAGQLTINLEEHVATANQLLGSGAVDDDLAVDALCHGKGDTAGEVTLDQTGNDLG